MTEWKVSNSLDVKYFPRIQSLSEQQGGLSAWQCVRAYSNLYIRYYSRTIEDTACYLKCKIIGIDKVVSTSKVKNNSLIWKKKRMRWKWQSKFWNWIESQVEFFFPKLILLFVEEKFIWIREVIIEINVIDIINNIYVRWECCLH